MDLSKVVADETNHGSDTPLHTRASSLWGMDALAGLLDGPRARGAFLLRMIMKPPWSLRIEDEAPLTVIAAVRGDAWILPDGGEPVRLPPGSVAVVRGPDPYT